MDLIQGLFVGVLQGIFEWLPVSSQGQIMAFSLAFLGLKPVEALGLAVFLHLGTLIAALFYFRTELMEIIQLKEKKLGKFILIAFLSTAFTGIPLFFILKWFIAEFNPFTLLLIIGLLLVLTGLIQRKKKQAKKTSLSKKNAFFLGLGQGLSVLPGVSRSGITTSVLLFEGFEPEKAFRLSFILSIPSVLIAGIGFGLMEGYVFSVSSIASLLAAAIVGFVSITTLLRIAKKIKFSVFCVFFGLIYGLIALAYFI